MAEITAQTIDKIVELSGAEFEGIVKLNADPRKVYYRLEDGTIIDYDTKPSFRNHKVNTIADFIEGLKSFVNEDSLADIFISKESVVGILDTNDRRDRITLPLFRSEAWLAILMLNAEAEYINQDTIMKLFRTTLKDAIPSDIVKICQNVRVTIGGNSYASNEQGKKGLGNDVDAKVTGRENIPDEFEMVANVYQNPDLVATKHKIATSFHVTPDCKFLLYPSRLAIEKAITDNQDLIYKSLTNLGNDHYRIFRGEFLLAD